MSARGKKGTCGACGAKVRYREIVVDDRIMLAVVEKDGHPHVDQCPGNGFNTELGPRGIRKRLVRVIRQAA